MISLLSTTKKFKQKNLIKKLVHSKIIRTSSQESLSYFNYLKLEKTYILIFKPSIKKKKDFKLLQLQTFTYTYKIDYNKTNHVKITKKNTLQLFTIKKTLIGR